MSNSSRRVVILGASSAGVAAMLVAALEQDVELVELGEVEPPREVALVCGPEPPDFPALVCDPRPGNYERGGKRGSADWKEHSNRRGKFKRR